MKLVMVVNNIMTEKDTNTTVHIAMAATNMGHEVWFTGVADFSYTPDERLIIRGRRVKSWNYLTTKKYLSDLQEDGYVEEELNAEDVDIIFLRNDPAEDEKTRPWAQYAGIIFGRLAVSRRIIVLNDPDGLSKSINKLYFQTFPESIRPKTLITRDREKIKQFYEKHNRMMIIKPSVGSQGRNVFLVTPEDLPNLDQLIDTVLEHGYVVAQEFISEIKNGDTRLFMLNGRILEIEGVYAAFRRVPKEGTIRTNIHAGGIYKKAEINEEIIKIAEIVSPKLIQDGIFFAGLDIVEDKLLEVNVFSPGGIDKVMLLEGIDFSPYIVRALERKVWYKKLYHGNFSNREINII